MSAVTPPVVLRTIARGGSFEGEPAVVASRPLVRLATFALLGGYAVLEWGKLIKPAPTDRLLGLLAIALAVVAVGPLVHRYPLVYRHRKVVMPAITCLAILGALAVCGIPVRWIVHVRIAVTADWISQGLQALPGIYIPYIEVDGAVKTVILLGAAVLLLDGAFLLAFAPAGLSDLRRAGAAIPLIALATVPATLVPATFPYLEGLLLFVMLAAFVWGERVRRDDLAALLGLCALTGGLGLFLAPRVDTHAPWINYRNISNPLRPARIARFSWANNYGPISQQWPRSGRTVLEVSASTPHNWKTQDLDQFDGAGWTTAGFAAPDLERYVAAFALAKWTETVQVTLRAMDSTDLVVAGEAQAPQDVPGSVIQGASPGTFADTTQLGPGTSYRVKIYAPAPSPTQLADAGPGYPPALVLQPYLTAGLPVNTSIQEAPQQVLYPLFGSGGAPANTTDLVNYPSGIGVIDQSPYRRAYELARTLARGARTPYAYVERVLHYLDSGRYGYFEDTPVSKYPLLTFLFGTHVGYCQHFAGAMALLLRMGGVPARVADGFTAGSYDAATRQYNVTATDAHAWVEAWFPKYGWVTFDPTPASADPALGGNGRTVKAGKGTSATPSKGKLASRHGLVPLGGTGGSAHAHHRGLGDVLLVAGGGVLAALLLVMVVLSYSPAEPSDEALIAELERAMGRAGRPISDDVTLAALEDRFGSSSEAAGYVRALRLARFAGRPARPTRRQRRAVRRQLRAGRGMAGGIRSLWALPPRWSVRRLGSRGDFRGRRALPGP